MITVRYFAGLRESLNCTEEQLTLSAHITDTDSLRLYLSQRDERWHKSFDQRLMIALNQKMLTENSSIKSDDEIAFFPPVTGG